MLVYIATKADCIALAAIVDKSLNLPAKGNHVGGGIHVDMPDTYKGKGASPGWTDTQNDPIEDTLKLRGWAYPADGLDKLDQSKLSAGEKTTLTTAIAASVILPTDWIAVTP